MTVQDLSDMLLTMSHQDGLGLAHVMIIQDFIMKEVKDAKPIGEKTVLLITKEKDGGR